MKALSNKKGSLSILEIFTGLTMVSMLAMQLPKLARLGIGVGKSAHSLHEKAIVSKLVREGLNCCQTLGITPTTTLPLPCNESVPYRVKSASGQALVTNAIKSASVTSIGQWDIEAKCSNATHELIVTRYANIQDIFMFREYNQTKDLFAGLSDFCFNCFAEGSTYNNCCGK